MDYNKFKDMIYAASTLKGLQDHVEAYQESKGYSGYDYGYFPKIDVWQCEFYDDDDKPIEKIVRHTKAELIKIQ